MAKRQLYPNLPEELRTWSPPFHHLAKCTRVCDGDSIWATINLGFHLKLHDEHIRLGGIDAPEIQSQMKFAAHESRRHLLHRILDKWVGLQTLADQRDKFGRVICIIWLPEDGRLLNINRWMLDNGHAVRMRLNRYFDCDDSHLVPYI